MPECVRIKFIGGRSVASGSILHLLEKMGEYVFANEDFGCVDFPSSPVIADEIKIWSPNLKNLLSACLAVIADIAIRAKTEIPVQISTCPS